MTERERLHFAFGEDGYRILEGDKPFMLSVLYAGKWRWFVGATLALAVDRAILQAAKVAPAAASS